MCSLILPIPLPVFGAIGAYLTKMALGGKTEAQSPPAKTDSTSCDFLKLCLCIDRMLNGRDDILSGRLHIQSQQ